MRLLMPAGYSVQSMYRCLQTMYHVYSHVQLCTDVTIWEGRVGAKCYQFGARCHQYNLILLHSLTIEPHFVRKGSRDTWTRTFTSVFDDRTSFRAKGLRRTSWNRNFTSVFDDRTSFRAKRFVGHLNSHFYLSFWRSNLISCERVARDNLKSQFYLCIWWSNLILCERVARDTWNHNFNSVFDDRTSFRAKGLRGTTWNRNDRTSFRATGQVEIAILTQFLTIEPRLVRKGCAGQVEIAILPQFLTIEPHFVRDGSRDKLKSQFDLSIWRSNLVSCERVARDKAKSQFYFSFWRSNLVSCERVAFRAVSLALPLPPPSEEK